MWQSVTLVEEPCVGLNPCDRAGTSHVAGLCNTTRGLSVSDSRDTILIASVNLQPGSRSKIARILVQLFNAIVTLVGLIAS